VCYLVTPLSGTRPRAILYRWFAVGLEVCCIKNGTYKDKLHEIAPCPRHTAAISEIVVFTIQLKRPDSTPCHKSNIIWNGAILSRKCEIVK